MIFSAVKVLCDWWYNFEIPEVRDPISLEMKKCRIEIFEQEQRQFLASKPHGLIHWIRYQRARWPKATGNRTALLIAIICIGILFVWKEIYNPAIDLKLLTVFTLLTFLGILDFIVKKTTFTVENLYARGRQEYIRIHSEASPLNSLEARAEVSKNRIWRQNKKFIRRYVLPILTGIAGFVGGQILEVFAGLSQYKLPKLLEIFWNLIFNNLDIILIITILLFLVWSERFWIPMTRVRGLLRTLRQERNEEL